MVADGIYKKMTQTVAGFILIVCKKNLTRMNKISVNVIS